MSTERLSFGFNSLFPETYKTKAEAFAKCLQHKLLSLGGIENSYSSESKKRLINESQQQEGKGNFVSPKSEYSRPNTPILDTNANNQQNGDWSETNEESSQEGRTDAILSETSQKTEKTEDSDGEFCSHSESENSDLPEQKRQTGRIPVEGSKQKLISMSSEDSTVESWSSCQENLTDLEKFDSENEEVNYFASQIRGSPKLRNLNIRCKRKEIREKPWKKNSKNHSSSTESIDSEGLLSGQGMKQVPANQTENFDSESHPKYILLDGLELEDDEVPHRILRESCSASNLEKHFSRSCHEDAPEFGFPRNRRSKVEQPKTPEESSMNADTDTPLTETSDLQSKSILFGNGEEETGFKSLNDRDPVAALDVEKNGKAEDLQKRLNFAEVVMEDCQEVKFLEVEPLQNFDTTDISRSVKKVGGVIVECPSDNNLRTDSENEDSEWVSEKFQVLCTSVDVLENKAEEEAKNEETKSLPVESDTSEEMVAEKVPTVVEPQDENEIQNSEDTEIMNNQSKLRRCSSLKTWKTPPGTPGAKKIVRFADALGLDLADVRTFLDEIPKVPSSAYEDLHFDLPSLADPLPPSIPSPTLIPLFQQPGHKMDFLEKVQHQKVCLETALVTDHAVLTVTGYVRVQNMSFHKSVHVRYSLNNWETFSDLQATYVPNSCDGFSDKFSFVLYGHTLKIGQKLEFALRLECSGVHYWDNNGGINYVFNCLPQSSANSFFSSLYNNQIDPWFEFY